MVERNGKLGRTGLNADARPEPSPSVSHFKSSSKAAPCSALFTCAKGGNQVHVSFSLYHQRERGTPTQKYNIIHQSLYLYIYIYVSRLRRWRSPAPRSTTPALGGIESSLNQEPPPTSPKNARNLPPTAQRLENPLHAPIGQGVVGDVVLVFTETQS